MSAVPVLKPDEVVRAFELEEFLRAVK